MSKLEKTQLQLGYIPLLDCIALLWAKAARFLRRSRFRCYLSQRSIMGKSTRPFSFWFIRCCTLFICDAPAAAMGADQIGIALQTPLVLSKNRAFISLSQN